MHLDPTDTAAVTTTLTHLGVLPAGASVTRLSRAGDGNMNLTLRAVLPDRSVIVKQARPWVEKYPSIAAPDKRALVEAAFYRAVAAHPPGTRMPGLLAVDEASRILVFEDLGEARDYADVYAGGDLSDADLDTLLGWLTELHALSVDDPRLHNRAMRALNHEHVFDLPFQANNGLPLDDWLPGLADAAATILDDQLRTTARALGRRYLADGPTLLHGDFYPGSFLRTEAGPQVIDPEFAFLGDPAFDVGVLAAHLVLAQQPVDRAERVLAVNPAARPFAGIEILRRLLGVAQLPLAADLEARTVMLQLGRAWALA